VVLSERTNGGPLPTLIGWEFLEAARLIVENTDFALLRLKVLPHPAIEGEHAPPLARERQRGLA
jgi:hypothetical protein